MFCIQNWKQLKHPSTCEWLNQVWYIHIMNHWGAKKKKLLIQITILIDKGIKLKRKNQSQKVTYCVVPLYIILFLTADFYLCVYFWLFWVFTAAHGPSLAVASRATLSVAVHSHSLQWCLLLQSMGGRAHGLSCPMACEIFPDPGDQNPCPLHPEMDS